MKKSLIAVAALVALCSAAEAQVKKRWRLHWSNEKPQVFTYRDGLDRYENYWFFTFTIENNAELNEYESVPLILDVMLYTETGKDLQDDVLKVDPANIKAVREKKRVEEPLRFGRFYPSVVSPEPEYKIIEYHAKLGNRSPGIVRESIENFKKGFTADPPGDLADRWKKGDRWYMNPSEIRRLRYILPGQKIMGIAIFKDVDPRARVYEVHVSGLVDIIKITAVTETDWQLEYEPHTLKIRYTRAGDEFEIERDVLVRLAHKEYAVEKIGPVGSKDTIEKLVMALADTLRKEKEWKQKDLSAEEIAERRKADGIDMLDTRIMAMVFKRATGLDFGFDGTKDVLANEKAVWKIHEWWVVNKTKLVYNATTNRFEVDDTPLPGTVKD